jgi:hypothetical protein
VSSKDLRLLVVSHYFDGTGNLIFGTRPKMVRGMHHSYGFLDVEVVVGVSALVRKTLRCVALRRRMRKSNLAGRFACSPPLPFFPLSSDGAQVGQLQSLLKETVECFKEPSFIRIDSNQPL